MAPISSATVPIAGVAGDLSQRDDARTTALVADALMGAGAVAGAIWRRLAPDGRGPPRCSGRRGMCAWVLRDVLLRHLLSSPSGAPSTDEVPNARGQHRKLADPRRAVSSELARAVTGTQSSKKPSRKLHQRRVVMASADTTETAEANSHGEVLSDPRGVAQSGERAFEADEPPSNSERGGLAAGPGSRAECVADVRPGDPLEPHRGALLFDPGGPGGEGIDSMPVLLRAAERRLCRRHPGDRHAEWRAGHIVQTDALAKLDRLGITTMLTAHADRDLGACDAALFRRDAHELADADFRARQTVYPCRVRAAENDSGQPFSRIGDIFDREKNTGEYGAEIARAVVNFVGPILFLVVSRYHGGAYVVFSRELNPGLRALAVEGAYASVIGGAPAATVVFAREVRTRVAADASVQALRVLLRDDPSAGVRANFDQLERQVTIEMRTQSASEFDAIHTVERALQVGSLERLIRACDIHSQLIELLDHSADGTRR